MKLTDYGDVRQRFWVEHFNRLRKSGHDIKGSAQVADQCLEEFDLRFPQQTLEEKDLEEWPYEVRDGDGVFVDKFATYQQAISLQKKMNEKQSGHRAGKRTISSIKHEGRSTEDPF